MNDKSIKNREENLGIIFQEDINDAFKQRIGV